MLISVPAKSNVDAKTGNASIEENVLDSDDDPDSDSDKPLKPLPRLACSSPQREDPSSIPKPRYLRECLDGMLLSKSEDTFINLQCTEVASQLIRNHPQSARELACEFVRVLVHVEPPAAPDEAKVDADRHSALVSLGVVVPNKCALFLTREFCQSNCSIGQRMRMLSAITDIACEMSMFGQPLSSSQSGINECATLLGTISGNLVGKTRRFCSSPKLLARKTNDFIGVAGDYFFPLLHSVPQLCANSEHGVFAHQDAALLANLCATLATIYACAHLSPQQFRMARDLLDLALTISKHNEPAVRRAALIATGTVITTTPLSLIRSHPELFFDEKSSLTQGSSTLSCGFVANWLKACATGDLDTECQLLATVGLSALSDRITEMSSCSAALPN